MCVRACVYVCVNVCVCVCVCVCVRACNVCVCVIRSQEGGWYESETEEETEII